MLAHAGTSPQPEQQRVAETSTRVSARRPAVSIVVAAYNASASIERAIRSVQSQSFAGWEMVIVDDCSTDGTLGLLKRLSRQDPRLKILAQPTNKGPSAARNLAISEAQGEWIAVLDADDCWTEERLAEMLAVAERFGADLVADNQLWVDDAKRPVEHAFAPFEEPRVFTTEEFIGSEKPMSPFKYGYLKPMFKTDFLRRHELAYAEDVRFSEDFLLYCEALLSGAKAVLTPRPMYVYTTGALHGEDSEDRPEYDHQQRVRNADLLLSRYGGRISRSERAQLRLYRRWAAYNARARTVRMLRRKSQGSKAISLLARHPVFAVHYLWRSKLFAGLRPRPKQA